MEDTIREKIENHKIENWFDSKKYHVYWLQLKPMFYTDSCQKIKWIGVSSPKSYHILIDRKFVKKWHLYVDIFNTKIKHF